MCMTSRYYRDKFSNCLWILALCALYNKDLKSLLMRVKEESERVSLKLRSWHLAPLLHGKQRVEKVKVVADFLLLGSKNTADSDCSHEVIIYLLLVRKAMTNLDSVQKQRHCQQRSIWSRPCSSQQSCMVLDFKEDGAPKN